VNEVILITANFNANDADLPDTIIRQENNAHCLPVRTLSEARVVARLFEILLDIELYRGTGRLFLP